MLNKDSTEHGLHRLAGVGGPGAGVWRGVSPMGRVAVCRSLGEGVGGSSHAPPWPPPSAYKAETRAISSVVLYSDQALPVPDHSVLEVKATRIITPLIQYTRLHL